MLRDAILMGFVLLNPSYGLRATDFGHQITHCGVQPHSEAVILPNSYCMGMTDGITEWTGVNDRFKQRGFRSRRLSSTFQRNSAADLLQIQRKMIIGNNL